MKLRRIDFVIGIHGPLFSEPMRRKAIGHLYGFKQVNHVVLSDVFSALMCGGKGKGKEGLNAVTDRGTLRAGTFLPFAATNTDQLQTHL